MKQSSASVSLSSTVVAAAVTGGRSLSIALRSAAEDSGSYNAARLPSRQMRAIQKYVRTQNYSCLERGDAPFEYQKYPRDHTWKFDGGHEMTASAAPAYLGNPKNVDPEEAFVASLSSCHMLTFLAVACKKKFVLDEYSDDAVGHMEKNENGKLAITRVELHPKIKFSGEKQPTAEELDEMHHFAHTECFIANSVKTKVTVEKLKCR